MGEWIYKKWYTDKKAGHKPGTATGLYTATKELKTEISKAKQRYKSKLEQRLRTTLALVQYESWSWYPEPK